MDNANEWSRYWTNEGQQGEVFVNKEGDKHPALANFWQDQFSLLKPDASIIDLASGAGSIFAHLAPNSDYKLHAADFSAEALSLLKQSQAKVNTIHCSADDLPLADHSFDLVVSQFGIEYATGKAFAEAGRLVADKGRLALLCHYQGGYIDQRNQAQLSAAQCISSTDFILHSIALITAAFEENVETYKAAEIVFIPAEQEIAQLLVDQPQGVHAHLYQGFRQMFERRDRYDLVDITGWLEAMKAEVERTEFRLSKMVEAANDELSINQLSQRLEEQGLKNISISPFRVDNLSLPVAWEITANR